MQIFPKFWQASPYIIAGFAGILMGLTPAPVEAWSLAWVALIPLWFLVAGSQSIRHSIICGIIWGIGYHGLALSWITGIHPMTWLGVPWLGSIAIAFFCWIFITLWGAILVAFWALGMTLLNNWEFSVINFKIKTKNSQLKTSIRILLGVALWSGLEAVWSASPLWWSSLSYTQSPHNLVILHLGQLSGSATITAAIVAVNGLIAEALIGYFPGKEMGKWQEGKWVNGNFVRVGETEEVLISLHRQDACATGDNFIKMGWNSEYLGGGDGKFINHLRLYLSLGIGLLFLCHLIGGILYSRPLIQPPETALKVGIIQGNIGNTIKLFTEGKSLALARYTSGYQKLANQQVDAVLTPEVALPFFVNDLKRVPYFYPTILEKGVVAWVGANGEAGSGYTNSLFTITGTGQIFSRYNKFKLVPLGEYIPLAAVFGNFINRLSPLEAHLVAGKHNQIFDTPFGRAIVGICYESAFPNHFRKQAAKGGEFILTASNNAHYSETMPAQHHAQDVMRAIENDRWAVRATNTGYSGIVDPHGQTVWISGINTYEIHADTIYRRQTQTLYVHWGDWLTPILVVLAVLGVAKSKLRVGH